MTAAFNLDDYAWPEDTDPGPRFLWRPDDPLVLSQCVDCRWKHRGTATCDGFPAGIPEEILSNDVDHR